MFRIVLSVLLLFAGFHVNAQDCFEFHKKNCFPEKGRFAYSVNNASASFAFSPGESKCVPSQLMQGKDYRITICSDSLYCGIVMLVIRDEDGKIMYDNSQDNFSASMEFSCRVTKNIEYVLTAPERRDVADDTKGCIGILVEEMVSPKIGF